jgi:hypothetical protein
LRHALAALLVVLTVAVLPASAQVSDSTPPVVTCGTADALWHATDVLIACTASDPESGIPNAPDQAFDLVTSVDPGTANANAMTDTRMVCNGGMTVMCSTAGPIGGNKVDKKLPTNPATIRSTDHRAGVWSRDRRISVLFSAATDGGSGVDGFSFRFAQDPGAIPDMVIDRQQTARGATSGLLGNGRWYFHISTRDNVGNWSDAARRGPFLIDFARPRVKAISGSGKTNRVVRLRYRTADNNGRTREKITISRGGSPVASWNRRMAPAQFGTIQGLNWRPATAASYSLCVSAWDRAGNTRRSCAGIRITNPAPPPARCHPSYPTVCIPPPPPDLDCGDIPFRDFVVLPPDPHRFDGNDNDGRGCES